MKKLISILVLVTLLGAPITHFTKTKVSAKEICVITSHCNYFHIKSCKHQNHKKNNHHSNIKKHCQKTTHHVNIKKNYRHHTDVHHNKQCH